LKVELEFYRHWFAHALFGKSIEMGKLLVIRQSFSCRLNGVLAERGIEETERLSYLAGFVGISVYTPRCGPTFGRSHVNRQPPSGKFSINPAARSLAHCR
jgi:hypothetical protein